MFVVFTLLLHCSISLRSQNDANISTNDSTADCDVTKEFLSGELNFIKHLITNEEFENTIETRLNLKLNCPTFIDIKDSIHYFSGWSGYRLKKLDFAISELLQVSETSPFYVKSQFYSSFCYAFDGDNKNAIQTLAEIPIEINNLELMNIKNLQLAGTYLLERDYQNYSKSLNQLDTNNYLIKNETERLKYHRSSLQKIKNKSQFLAGLFSAVIPGSGKFYAGYKGQAIAAAIPTILFGAVATEQYFKSGPKSFQFISFASLFSIFYVGNIWGSVISVRTYRDDINNKIDNGILVDMHIPLRRFFD